MHFTYPRDLKALSQLTADLKTFAEVNCLNSTVIHCFNLCLDELLTNIISYGYYDESEDAAHLSLSLNGDSMFAEIRDQGYPFNPLEDAPPPDLDADLEHRDLGGLGIHFCKVIMDDLEYRREGDWNILIMRKATTSPNLDD